MSVHLKATPDRVLRLIADRPVRVKDLIQPGLSEPTIYRQIGVLDDEGGLGFVTDKEGVYSITPAGQAWLDERTDGVEVTPDLPIPALDKAPSAEHRSFLVLGVCAAAGRTHGVADRSLGGFVLVGPSGSFKTTTARGLVALTGGDVAMDVLDAGPESGKGLLVRRNAHGEEVTRCHLFEVPVAVFDEAEKIDDPKARNILENIYFAGTSNVNNEGHVLAVKCVPVATMNPVDPDGTTFEELTGLHSSRERRVALVQLPKVKISTGNIDDDWLAKMITLDEARHPKLPAPRNAGLKAAGRFRTIIDLVIRDPQLAERKDPHVLNNFARGATAWLDDERAIRLVAINWARLMATSGECHPDWELILQTHFAPKEVLRARRARKRAKRMKRLDMAVKTHLGGDVELALKVIAREGVARREAPELARAMEAIARMIVQDLDGNFEAAMFLLQLEVALRKKGLSCKLGASLAEYAHDLELSPDEADLALELSGELARGELSPATALRLAKVARQLGLSTKDASYCLELGFELAERGFKFKDLPAFDRAFCKR